MGRLAGTCIGVRTRIASNACSKMMSGNAHLPPPLNLVVYLTYPAVALVLCTRQQWTGRQSHDKGADLWICYHCHHCNPALDEAHAEAELKKWIKDVEGRLRLTGHCVAVSHADARKRFWGPRVPTSSIRRTVPTLFNAETNDSACRPHVRHDSVTIIVGKLSVTFRLERISLFYFIVLVW